MNRDPHLPRRTPTWFRVPRGQRIAPLLFLLVLWQICAGADDLRTCSMDHVLDGDSLVLNCSGQQTEVRLHCIDAPEHGQEPWGERAKQNLRRITPAQVRMQVLDTDRFGRLVVELSPEQDPGESINLQQVRGGFAAVYRHYCRDGRFYAAERQAREAREGIWSQPGEQQTPWRFRHRH